MFRLLGYLKQCKKSVLAIIILLIVQAYCDLALPQYTSDIVDVGIQQGGIEHAAPEWMREETYDSLKKLMTSGEEAVAASFYEKTEDGSFRRTTDKREHLEQLNEVFSMPMAMLSGIEDMAAQGADGIAMPEAAALLQTSEFSDEQLLELRKKISAQMGDMSPSMLEQKALLFVRQEYEAMGKDTGAVQTKYLIMTGARMLGFTLLMVMSAILVSLLASRAAALIGKNLRGQVFDRVMSFSNAEMHRFSTASLITRSTNDIQQVQMVAVMLLRMVIYAPIVGIGGVLKVTETKTGMAWIIALAVAVIMAVVLVLMGIAMPKFQKMQQLVDRLNLVSREVLTGLPVIRAFSREKFEEERFDRANRDLMKTQLFTNRVMTLMMPTMMLIMNCVTVMIVWFGAKGIDTGSLQVGDMIAFMTYTMQIVMSFLMLTMVSVMLPRAGVAADRIEEILNTDSSVSDAEDVQDEKLDCRGVLSFEDVSFKYPGADDDALEHISFTAEPGKTTAVIGSTGCGKSTLINLISFEDVSFKYPGADDDALEHISFTAEPGKTTAVIGSTGCGKSTLINLIPRFYDVTEGRILLDGVDIRQLSQHRLREVIGLVPQKGILFSGTIASNIKLAGEDRIGDAQMREAARIAQAEEFIEGKPDQH